jgi:arylsulfatase A-like enzyme
MTRRRKTMLWAAALLMAAQVTVAQKRPNIILILADDMGYSDIGSYGGEVSTPNLDQLAKEGVRYKQFYNAARCCPTRASLMTGLYPHQAGMGWMAAANLGTPAYQDDLNKQSVTIAEVLKTAGYSTFMTGKWHLSNERKIDGKVTDSWPHQRGFDRYFGIVPGGANYFTPTLYSNNTTYKAPDNFYLTNAISDTSVRYIREHTTTQKDKPFFMYVAYTAPHWPLHALQSEIDKYKEVYTRGWDAFRKERFERQKAIGLISPNAVLSPRDMAVPAWETLTEEKKKEMAMRMAIYAAQIDIMDQGIGRIVAELKEQNILDNTLIFFLSDNGACAEFISSGKSKEVNGAAETFESYRIDWANLSSTPFREFKHYTNEGGIATPLIVHWPQGVRPELNGSFISEYGHLTDILATCVEVAGAKYPKVYDGHKIQPMEGKSLVPHFSGASNNRGKVYWEHEANIALRDGKWKMVAKTEEGKEFDEKTLQLFDLEADPTEMNNLAAKYPERLKAMYADWLQWAKKIGAFPLDTRNYNVRMQAYRRTINGSFDDDLGGWNIRKSAGTDGSVEVDHSGQISGRNSALVVMTQSENKPAGLVMNWPFSAKKGEQFQVHLQAKANGPASFIVRLEKASGEPDKLIDQEVIVSSGIKKASFQSLTVPEDGNYKVAIYLGRLQSGDKVWIDNVELVPVQKM